MPVRIPADVDRSDPDALAAWLESDDFDPSPDEWKDAAPLRAIARTARDVCDAERRRAEAVAGARRAGHSWGAIAVFLGVSRQAARKRYGSPQPV